MMTSPRACLVVALGFLVLAAAGLPAEAATGGLGGNFEPGVDRPGSDYTSFDIGNSAGRCQSACLKDARCRAWTFVKPGIQGPSARCWLKSAVPAAVKNACCTSGTNAAVKFPSLLCYENQADYGPLGSGPPKPCRAPPLAKRGQACSCSNFRFPGIVK
jgi:hypothetical protein